MRFWLLAFAGLLVTHSTRAAEPKLSAEGVEFFEKHVRPVLVEHCLSCHGEKKQQAGLRLDTAVGFRKGSDAGPIMDDKNVDQSRLVKSIHRQGEFPMPPTKPLPKEALAALDQWVKIGAPFPEANSGVTQLGDPKKHWAFQPVSDPPVPATKTDPGTANPLDRFVLAKLEAKGGTLAARADKRTLIRRATYDLLGLPPTFAEVEAFEKDTDPKAFDKLVDRLLASPHYGERWGRYWLDLARYADSKGYVFTENRAYPYAYTFRDYVIRSLNEDKPYNQFLLEQLAADRLPLGEDQRPLAAMGFLTVGRRFGNNVHDIIDDRIDLVTRGLMGLTVGCARCHDHKYDPIPIGDYYSLYGVFASSNEPKDLPLIGDVEKSAEYDKFQAELTKRESDVNTERERLKAKRVTGLSALVSGLGTHAGNFERILNRADRNAIGALQKKVDEFKATSPVAPPRAMVMNDNRVATQPVVFLRGNPNNRGPQVTRHFPTAVSTTPSKSFSDGSGRLELAKAIASADNPLTARVFVNRVWGHHFGQPLVRTPSDFGIRSEPPTHPELLDWLAKRFMDDGWSIKKLHRRMMLSATYQQATQVRSAEFGVRNEITVLGFRISTPHSEFRTPHFDDPENRLLGHANRRRLDWEALRDSLLAASGQLDRTVFGRSVDLFTRPFPTRRSVYASIDRQNLPGTLSIFDFANPDAHSPQRFLTTVPQQSLFLMNSPFVAEQVRAVVKRSEFAAATTDETKVRELYKAVLARQPSAAELKLAMEFIVGTGATKPNFNQLGSWELLAQVLLLSNEFAFVD